MRQIQGFCIGHDAADEIRRFLYGLFQAFAADDGRRDDGRKDIACAAAVAAGANPPRKPMSSTLPAAFARTPMTRAAGWNAKPSSGPAPQPMSSAETMRNGNSDTSSGPPQSTRPACRASAQRCGAANTKTAVNIASASSIPCRNLWVRFISKPSASIYM